MSDLIDRARQHLADALTRKMHRCDVTEWPDADGNPGEVYWRPVTGAQQIEIDQGKNEVDRVCLTLKVRALDAEGRQIFRDTPLVSLKNDFDYDVIRAIVYIIVSDIGQGEDVSEAIEKE